MHVGVRAVLSFLSGGGMFFVASCHERVSRAFVHFGAEGGGDGGRGPIDETTFKACAVARLCTAGGIAIGNAEVDATSA